MNPSLNAVQPTFETARLRVWQLELEPSPHNTPRLVYIACRKDEDRPMVTATAVIFTAMQYVDWVEVTSEYRRDGFATELLHGIEKHLGVSLICDPGSDLGEKFCATWNPGGAT